MDMLWRPSKSFQAFLSGIISVRYSNVSLDFFVWNDVCSTPQLPDGSKGSILISIKWVSKGRMMMKMTKLVLALAVSVCFVGTSYAQPAANHDVTIVVPEFNLISVSGSITMTLSAPANAGDAPGDAVNSSGSFAVTTNATTAKKITAALGGAYASGISLSANLTGLGTSAGAVTLTTTAQDVVTALSNVAGSGGITYTASATSAASPNGGGESQTVTYTLTN